MPRRKRASKRREELTLERHLLLTLGAVIGPGPDRPYPTPGTDEWEALRVCWHANRNYFAANAAAGVETYWGYRVFEAGDDPEAASIKLTPVESEESGCD